MAATSMSMHWRVERVQRCARPRGKGARAVVAKASLSPLRLLKRILPGGSHKKGNNGFVDPEAKVFWDQEGYIKVKPEETKLNNFEKVKLAKNPLKLMADAGNGKSEIEEMAAKAKAEGFESVDKSSKEAQADIDIRLKWFGLFHRRKQQYGKFMMRLKLPNGIVKSDQLHFLASIVEKYGEEGCGDITTRQNFQLRGVELPDVPEIFDGLQKCGLTSIQSGMDNVRNAVGSPLAGIDPLEIVDTIPICEKLNEYIIAKGKGNRSIANLPRKWNVCVVGSQDLYEHPHINDLAYEPAKRDGEFGFNLLVGGFFSATKCEEAIPLDAWVPESDVVAVCDAILTTFRDFGARSARQKCRMMWLIHDMGLDEFRRQVEKRMPNGKLLREGESLLDVNFKRRDYHGVHKQKQEGLNYVGINVPAGRINAKDMHEMARLADEYGSGEIRLTVEQNYILPNIPDDKVDALLKEPLLSTGEGFASAFKVKPGPLVKNLVACTGNQFCGQSFIETKAQGKALAEALEATMDFSRDVRMHWTGCPNTCGQVQVADIGFLGCQTRNPNGKGTVDGVKIFLGGNIGHEAELGNEIGTVPCSELLPYTQNLLKEKFGAKMKSNWSMTRQGKQSVTRWKNFPTNIEGTERFPPNSCADYVTAKSQA